MSIKQERITQIMNMIIKQCISEGQLPTEKYVIDQFRTYILVHDPAKPKLNPKYALRGTNINFIDVNSSLDDIYGDLSLLYNRCLKLNAALMSTYMLADKQKTALDNELLKLESDAKALVILKNSSTYLNCAYDSFIDFEKVDSATTTADVDIAKNKVTINYNKVLNKRINQEPIISVSYPQYSYPVDITYEGEMTNMNDDYDNTTFKSLVTMEEKSGCILEVTYDYGDNPVDVNQINVKFSTASTIYARLLYSPDNINVLQVPCSSEFVEINNDPVTINFAMIHCKYIKFVFMKDKEDSIITSESGQNYLYDYTLIQLALFNMQYGDGAILQSLPLLPTKNIDSFSIGKISLSVESNIPAQTNIEYYVALEPQLNQPINWNRMSPIEDDRLEFPSIIDFMDNTTADNLVGGIASKPAEHELPSLNTRGISMYSVYKTEEIISRIVINKGLNASLVKLMPIALTNTIPNIDFFSEDSYYNYNIINSVSINSMKQAFSTAVLTSVNFKNIIANNTIILAPNIPYPTVIYLNGIEVQNGLTISSITNSLPLRVGVNNISVMSYVPANAQYEVNLGIDLIATFGQVLAYDTPMSEVDLFELQNTVMSNDHSKFALYTTPSTTGNTTHIVMNDEDETVKYQLSYSYKDTGNTNNLMFKAIFTRQPYCLSTPSLFRYIIFCE